MKKMFCLTMAILVTLAFAACGAPEAAQSPSEATSVEALEVVKFTDPVLEAKVREAMSKPEGDITVEEAETVTKMDLGIDWQQEPAEGTQIKDLSGIENFTNLEELGLHYHAITDISPLAGLKKLTSLSLGGNPVADISPLAGLANLEWLTLFGCQAEDYSTLATLTKLNSLLMEYSTIKDADMLSGLTGLTRLGLSNTQVSDVSPLASLTNLKKLQLAGSPVTDYSPLAAIYPNLEEADFTIVSSLRELGFVPIDNAPQLESYKTEEIIVLVHHTEWGEQQNKDEENAVTLYKNQGTENEICVIYYPDNKKYLIFSNLKEFRYTYDSQSGEMNVEYGGENANAFMEEAYDEVDPYPVMTPIRDFSKVMTDTFGVSADILYNLPREAEVAEASTLIALGFVPDKSNAVCIYEQHEGNYTSIAIHRPEWGEQEYSVHFFTSVNGYGVMVRYYIDEQRYYIRADNEDGSTADFEFFSKDNSYRDGMSPDGMTVEEFFKKVYDEPQIEDVYLYSVLLAQQYITDTFGMTIDEMYALPVGE